MKSVPYRVRRLFIVDYALTPEHRIEECAILTENEHIIAIGGLSAFALEEQLEIHRLEGAYATPGFIDSHIHGAGGFDASSSLASPRSLDHMSRVLAEHGVTSFVPTVVSDDPESMLGNLQALSQLMSQPVSGADPVGIHLEGPFINPGKRGSMRESSIRPIDLGYLKELLEASRGLVKRVTFAPELKGAVDLVEYLCSCDITPSMGHSLANDVDTLRAIDAGAHCCTHLFNGMPSLAQRQMTITSVALTDSRVSVELIIDGRHLHPRIVDLACRCKPDDKIVGISDATMAAAMPSGDYRIGPTAIRVEHGYSRDLSGTLAGTTTLLDDGWHSLMSYSHTPETYAAAGVSRNPALQLGLKDRGRLVPGLRADIAIFECGTNRPLMTVRRGEVVYQAGR